MSIHHENMNQQITKTQVDQILTQETRVARNMEKDTQGYDRQFYSMEQTRQDMKLIDQALHFPTAELEITDQKKYRLQAIQGRNLSHVLLNSTKTTGDSKEMANVKNSIESLEQKLAEVRQGAVSVANIEEVENAYLLAISHCQYYCDHKNPTFQTGKERKQLVMDTLARLRREAGWLAEAKQRIREGEQFEDVQSVRDLLEKGEKAEETPVETPGERSMADLTYNDFIAVLGTYNRGQVEFSGGELKIINNGMLSRSKGDASTDNYLLRQRFLTIVMQRLGNDRTPELMERMQKILEIDFTVDQALPLSRQAIHDVIALVNMRSSVVAKTLHRGSKEDPVQFALAKKAHQMIGGNANAYERSFTTSEREKNFKEEINKVLKIAREWTWNDGRHETFPELTERQMDRLVKGNLSLLRDQIYIALEKCRAQITHLTGGGNNGLELAEGTWNTDKVIAARVIHLVAASTETGRALAEHMLEETISNVAFYFVDENEIGISKTCKALRFGDLSERGSNGLQEAVEERLSTSSVLQGDMEKTRLGMESLKELCDKLQKLDEWKARAIQSGLSSEDATQMIAFGNELDELCANYGINKNRFEAMELVAKELEGTRFAVGFAALKARLEDEKERLKIRQLVKTLAEETTCPEAMLAKERQQEAPQEEQGQMTSRDIRYELDMLAPGARKIASVLLLADSPSAFINANSVEEMQDYKDLYRSMRYFAAAGGTFDAELRVAGVDFRLFQEDSQILKLEIDGKKLTIPANAAIIADAMETDVIGHEELYGAERVREVIDELEVQEENMAEWIRSRKLCLKVLTGKTGQPSDFFNNVPAKKLKDFASKLLAGQMTVDAVIEAVDKIENYERINGDETLELLKMQTKMQEQERELGIHDVRVSMPEHRVTKQKEEGDWSDEEEKVKDLVSDLVFSQETWKADETMKKPVDRLRLMLEKHVDALVMIIKHPQMVEEILAKIPLEGMEELRDTVRDALNGIRGFVPFLGFMNDGMIRSLILNQLQTKDAENTLKEIDAQIEETVQAMLINVQKNISAAVKDAFGEGADDANEPDLLDDTTAEDNLKKVNEELKKFYKEHPYYNNLRKISPDKLNDQNKAEQKELMRLEAERDKYKQESVDKLNKIMEKSAQGSSGQGKFIRIVLENYFMSMPLMDQRAMFASALRNAKPRVALPEDATEEMKTAQLQREGGIFLSGILKGAGPLLQKMMQGLPLEAMPEVLRDALRDMKSNLAPIPDEIVKAQLLGMVERSHGKVTRIEVTRALGAASVGQAFLCKIYGPGIPDEGSEVVVKLLRPDVRNRMEREKWVMLSCANQTDENRGMWATYSGQLLRIAEELDLSFEAQNVEAGKVYDQKTTTVQSMKVNSLIEPTVNSLVLEKAPGTTIDKYLDELHEMKEKLERELYAHNADGSVKMIKKDQKTVPQFRKPDQMYKIKKHRDMIAKKLAQLQKRQTYLADLAQQWVTEGIFGKGFYHGDLHAGNMLIDDDGLTVIDFGNATTLTSEQQTEVTRMVAAAAAGDSQAFCNGLHRLLEHTSEEVYQEKQKALGETVEKVFRVGNQESSGQRIAVALLKAQELGIEVPSAIFNFSQCQLRLQNTLDEMNSMISSMKKDLDVLNDATKDEVKVKGYFMNENLNQVSKERFTKRMAEREKFMLEADQYQGRGVFTSNYQTIVCGPKNDFESLKTIITDILPKHFKGGQPERPGQSDGAKKLVDETLQNVKPYLSKEEVQHVETDTLAIYHKMKYGVDCKAQVAALCTYLDRIEARGRAEANEYDTVCKELQKAYKDNKPAEELAQLKERAYDAYCEAHRSYIVNYALAEVREKLEDPEQRAAMDETLEPMFRDQENDGETLQALYNALRDAQDQQDEELIREMESAFLHQYYDMILNDLEKPNNDGVKDQEPDTFFDIMAEVICENLMASLKRLGTAAIKYSKILA